MTYSEDPVKVPAIGVSLQVTLDQRRQLVLQSHADQENPAQLDVLLDRLTRAADRQDAKYLVETVKRLLRQAERNLLDTEAGMARTYEAAQQEWEADGSRQGEFKASGSVATDINNSRKSADRFREEIAAHTAEIARLEKLAE